MEEDNEIIPIEIGEGNERRLTGMTLDEILKYDWKKAKSISFSTIIITQADYSFRALSHFKDFHSIN